MNCSRRTIGAILLTPFFRSGLLRALAVQAGGEPAKPRIVTRTYRADAVILLLGLPIYRRAGVGGGQASIEESGEGASLRRTFFFAGGSDATRAHGLNRLGWIREIVIGPVGGTTAIEYFGVMTSSPEESLEGARKSVEGPSSGRSVFSAVSGKHTPGHSRSSITHFESASGSNWSDHGLISQAEATFQHEPNWRESSWPKAPAQPPSTFLLELANLLQQRTKHAVGRYVYCEQEYTMELETSPKRDRDNLLVVHAKVRNLHTGKENVFRVWMDAAVASLIPVRIEYQARSFLRLTFESIS